MKVALYARVSKSDDSQTTENQLMRLRTYVDDNKYEVYEEYQDFASGADPNRPALEKMMRDARGHRFGIIFAVKVDRIARSNIHLYNMISELAAARVGFHCIDQPEVSTETSTGKALLGILGVMAELERDLIRERTNAGLARARAQGKVIGRPKKMITPGQIADLRASGMTIIGISKKLGVSKNTVIRRMKAEGPKIGGPNLTLRNLRKGRASNPDGSETKD